MGNPCLSGDYSLKAKVTNEKQKQFKSMKYTIYYIRDNQVIDERHQCGVTGKTWHNSQ